MKTIITEIYYHSHFSLFICISVNCQDKNNSIRPGQIWPDNEGKHINAHGGGIIFYNDTYYWFGEYRFPGQKRTKAVTG